MKKLAVLFIVLSLLVPAVSTFAQSNYDRSTALRTMREFMRLSGGLGKSIQDKNYYAVADAFYGLAKGAQTLKAMKAPKGSQAEWEGLWEKFIDTSLKGVGASGAKNDADLNRHLEEIYAYSTQGHGKFR